MGHLNLLDALIANSVAVDYLDLRRYEDGSTLLRRDCRRSVEEFGAPWL